MSNKEILQSCGVELDVMFSDTGAFAASVYAAADELSSIIRSDVSLKSNRGAAEKDANRDKEAFKAAKESLQGMMAPFYHACDNGDHSANEIYHMAKLIKAEANHVMNYFESEIDREVIDSAPTIEDKEEALYHHEIIRETFNSWRGLAATMDDKKFAPLKGVTMTDNSIGRSYPVYIVKDETYYSYRTVANLIGADIEFHNHQDLVDYINENDIKTVTIKKVTR